MDETQDIVLTATFKISDNLNRKLDEKIITDGYGMRGKSKWIREAVEKLFTYIDFSELVSLSDDLEYANHPISVRLSRRLLLDIEKMVVSIRKEYPELEGVKSRIIRTAIIQRLIRA
ncbi:MAG: hypothetical protein KKE11_04645 [Gammaproteobacteria bacterium]|nr:hypothetical protein [Gammaproteobacteria bacterium]